MTVCTEVEVAILCVMRVVPLISLTLLAFMSR